MADLPALVFAHAGGFSWDEALLVMAPIAALSAVFWVANNRAKKQQQLRGAERQDPSSTSTSDAEAVTDDIP